jgi:predicted transcriptional regulator
MPNCGSKFYSRSLTLLVQILKMIDENFTLTKIAKVLNIKKSHVSYYFKKAKLIGYVNEVFRDRIKILELTQAGKNFVDQYEKLLQQEPNLPICRAENIRFKAEVTHMPTIPVDWKKVQMHNWVQFRSEVDTIRVHLNMGEHPTIELIPSPVDGKDPNDMLITLTQDCLNVLVALEDHMDMRFGRLQKSSRPEWVVYDPIAKSFCQYNGQVTVDGVGKVNASAPLSIGEFEFNDPRDAAEYISMPRRVYKIEQRIEEIVRLLKGKKSDSDDGQSN